MPKRGSAKVLSFTSAATTVVGTVASCHPLGTNCAVEMTSPLASTLAEVCRDQPAPRVTLASAACFICAVSWAKRNEARRNWVRTKREIASRLLEFMTLLINGGSCLWSVRGKFAKCPREWITFILIRFNSGVSPKLGGLVRETLERKGQPFRMRAVALQ